MLLKHRFATQLFGLVFVSGVLSGTANATDFFFNVDPFAGSTALQTPGRQFVGNELFINNFNIATDRLVFDPVVFGTPASPSFVNSFANALPAAGATFISLRDIDADGNPLNGVANNAGLSANLIAANTVGAGPGFFLYYNSALDLNRLVFSPDLSSPTADLKILARFTNQTGSNANLALQQFSAANVAVTAAVPEPTTWAMLLIGFGAVGCSLRGRHRGVRLRQVA